MKRIILAILFIVPLSMISQKNTAALQKDAREYVREGNELYNQQKFADAEVAYKKALEKDPNYEIANYNLGNALSQQKRGDEAFAQYQLVAKTTEDKFTRSESFHNIGNTHFDAKKYQESIEAYKHSLRNNPKDDETRYNLALAQKMLEDQQNKDKDKDKDNKDNKDQNKDDKQDKDQDKKDGDDKKDDQKDQDKNKDKQDKKDQKPSPNKLSPQQIQQLLEAMNNEEKKTQEKMNARKEKGKKIKQEKDW